MATNTNRKLEPYPAPGQDFPPTLDRWLRLMGTEMPVVRFAIIDITVPAVGANSTNYNPMNYIANSGSNNLPGLTLPQADDLIVAHFQYLSACTIPCVELRMSANSGQVQAWYVNPTGAGYAGGTDTRVIAFIPARVSSAFI